MSGMKIETTYQVNKLESDFVNKSKHLKHIFSILRKWPDVIFF